MTNGLTFEIHDDVIPVVKTFATGHTVRQGASGAPSTAVTLESRHSIHTLTLTTHAVTLQGGRTLLVTVTSWHWIEQEVSWL